MNKVDLTNKFRTQKRVITNFTHGIDLQYLQGEVGHLLNTIVAHANDDRVEEVYTCYLYGRSFVENIDHVGLLCNNEFKRNGLSGFRFLVTKIGTAIELATYPSLCGVRVQVTTIN